MASSSTFTVPEDVFDIDKYENTSVTDVTDYVGEIYDYLRHVEVEKYISFSDRFNLVQHENPTNTRVTEVNRITLLDWLVDVHLKFKLTNNTLHNMVAILDRVLCVLPVVKRKLQLVGLVCFQLAIKLEEVYPSEIRDLVYICDMAYSRAEFLAMERVVLHALNFEIILPIPITFLRRFSQAARFDSTNHTFNKYLLESCLVQGGHQGFLPSQLAAGCTWVTRIVHHSSPDVTEVTDITKETSLWTPTLCYYTEYSEEQLVPVLTYIVDALEKTMEPVPKSVHMDTVRATVRKYTTRFFGVAKHITVDALGKIKARILLIANTNNNNNDNDTHDGPSPVKKRKISPPQEPETPHDTTTDVSTTPDLTRVTDIAGITDLICVTLDEHYGNVEFCGRGVYGTVYKATMLQPDIETLEVGDTVAIKKFRVNDASEGYAEQTTLRELALLKELTRLGAPNILNIYQVIQAGNGKIYAILPYMPHVLRDRLRNPTVSCKTRVCWTRQLLTAIAFCHSHGIIHRDLKPCNILLDTDDNVQVCDFGHSRSITVPVPKYTQEVTTLHYRAPEILLGAKQYGCEIDVWAAGCVIGQMFKQQTLFAGSGEFEQLRVIFATTGLPTLENWPGVEALPHYNQVPQDQKALSPTEWKALLCISLDTMEMRLEQQRRLYTLLDGLLTLCPERRITAKDGLKCDFFL